VTEVKESYNSYDSDHGGENLVESSKRGENRIYLRKLYFARRRESGESRKEWEGMHGRKHEKILSACPAKIKLFCESAVVLGLDVDK
jgi:hypothetical protein